MKVPKQIIHPLNYARLAFDPGSADSADLEQDKFVFALAGIFGNSVKSLPIGRARMGIYLLVKQALSATRKKVILNPYTIPDVVNMVILAGGQPIFVDLDSRSTNVDLDLLESLIDDKVACVLITHYHVNQANFGAIKQLCEQKQIALFEDCAISLGGTLEGHHVGTLSDGAILSLSGYKFLNYFWGGVVFTRHAAVTEWINAETAHWRRLTLRDYVPQMLRVLKYDLAMSWPLFDLVVFPLIRKKQRNSTDTVSLIPPRLETLIIDGTLTSLPSRLAFAEWNSKINRIDSQLAHRREVAAIYDQYLGTAMVSCETDAQTKAGSCFLNYPIYVGEKNRNTVYKAMIESGFDVGASLYPNCGDHERFKSIVGATSNARDLVRSVITLPTHPRVTPAYAEKIGHRLSNLL